MGMPTARKDARLLEEGIVASTPVSLARTGDKEDTEEVCIVSHELSIRMGRIRKDSHSMIYHEASAKDISPCRANGPQEMAHGIRRKTSIERKSIPLAKERTT
ncbi:hypothetical protein Tco_0916665 [Tanacetum coccineum]